MFLTPLAASPDPLREPLYTSYVGNCYVKSVWSPLTLSPCGPLAGDAGEESLRPAGENMAKHLRYDAVDHREDHPSGKQVLLGFMSCLWLYCAEPLTRGAVHLACSEKTPS